MNYTVFLLLLLSSILFHLLLLLLLHRICLINVIPHWWLDVDFCDVCVQIHMLNLVHGHRAAKWNTSETLYPWIARQYNFIEHRTIDPTISHGKGDAPWPRLPRVADSILWFFANVFLRFRLIWIRSFAAAPTQYHVHYLCTKSATVERTQNIYEYIRLRVGHRY